VVPGRATPSLFESRSDRVRRFALVAACALVLVWLADAAVDVLILGRGDWLAELVRPTVHHVWMRLQVAALLTLLFVVMRGRTQEHLLSAALEEAPDGVQIADLGGRVAWSNRAVQQIYGFTPEELQGRHVDSMNADPGFAQRVIFPAMERTGRWAGELEVKHKDGRTFPVWLSTALIAGRNGKPIAAVGVIRDITERRSAEDRLRTYATRLEDATRMKDLFADILRHDLLSPATALRVTIDVVARRDPNPAAAKPLAQARRACERLAELIDHAAKYAKVTALEQIEVEDLDLRALLEEVAADAEVACEEQHASVALDVPAGLRIRGHRLVLDVFSNLVSNALKYGPPGGAVDVSVADGGDAWIVGVADRGPGVPDADKQRIFTRFERIEREGVKGTGLGLAIARHVVQLHGGRIWVEDRPGGGSVFRVALPKAT
jgi:PAS domain S-box-containing protein